jgi:hypothetical protein
MKKIVLVLFSIFSFMMQTKGPQAPRESEIPFISADGRLNQQQTTPVTIRTQQSVNQYNNHATFSLSQRKPDEHEKQRSCLSCLCCLWFWKK